MSACTGVLAAVRRADGYPARWPDDPAAWIALDGSTAWVAELDGSVVGHACVVWGVADPVAVAQAGVPAERMATLSRLFVAPAARGRGVAAALVGVAYAATSVARRRLSLDVVDDDGAAVRLYERLGWQVVDRRPADWVTPSGVRLPVRVYLAPTASSGQDA